MTLELFDNPNLAIDKGGSQQTGLDAKWKHPNDGSSALQPSATDSKMDSDAGASVKTDNLASDNSPEFNLESCNSQAPKISQQGAVTRAEILGEVSGSQDILKEDKCECGHDIPRGHGYYFFYRPLKCSFCGKVNKRRKSNE